MTHTFLFISAAPKDIQRLYPKLFVEGALYFYLMKNDAPSALYGIMDRGNGKAELFMTLFKKDRFCMFSKNQLILNRKAIKEMIKKPFLLGFNEVWTWTRFQSWKRILKHFQNDGVVCGVFPEWDDDQSKMWFKRVKEGDA